MFTLKQKKVKIKGKMKLDLDYWPFNWRILNGGSTEYNFHEKNQKFQKGIWLFKMTIPLKWI